MFPRHPDLRRGSSGSSSYPIYSDAPGPSTSSAATTYYYPSPPSFESLAQATIRPPPPPLYSPHDEHYAWQGGQYLPSNRRPSFQSDSASFASRLDKDLPTVPGYSELDAKTTMQNDGRLEVAYGYRMSKQFPQSYGEPVQEPSIDETGFANAPPMSINIMIVGSRGDVQPYLALGQKLKQYGHTVRLSTHETFRKLVKDAGLRFFNIGGDPHELMSYMVRNPGLIPGFESLRNGDIAKKQKMVAEILEGCFLSCFSPDPESPDEPGFVADAIISNPPTFAHIHCAEALGIPLLLSFTMPWCPTASFPHPLVNIKQSENTELRMANYYSYGLVELMTWQGLGRTINKFRMKRLGLDYLTTASAVGCIERCSIPWTYCLSPALVEKPKDWMSHIDVVGFYFLDLAANYQPPEDLVKFLRAGPPPVYVGFGSIVLEHPQEMTRAILDGIRMAGVRAIVSPGWGGLDADLIKSAGPHVFALGNVPHDWLFEHVSAVCHHGGAGTTAIGLKCGKPTIIVPFFGDQPWWAAQIARRGAGPPPLSPKHLTAEAFASALQVALSSKAFYSAQVVGRMIREEDGVKNGVESFHRHMPLLNMRCDLDPSRVAVWYYPKYKLRLSAFAAQVLVEAGSLKFNFKKLHLHRSREYDPHIDATDPVTGSVAPAMNVLNNLGRGVAKLPTRPVKGVGQILAAGTLGVQSTLKGTAQGFSSAPKLMGVDVRERKNVTGLGSGIAQGTKSLFLGCYDGVGDLVREPIKGYKHYGPIGAVAGLGIGAVCATTKPLAGALNFVSMPLEGTVHGVRSWFHTSVDKERAIVRVTEGILAAKRASREQKDLIVALFLEHKWNMKKGKGKEKAQA